MNLLFVLFVSFSFGEFCYFGEEIATWNENTKEMLYTKDYHFLDETKPEATSCLKCTKVCEDPNSGEFVFDHENFYQFEEDDILTDNRYPYTTVYVGEPTHTIRFVFDESRQYWYHKPVFSIPFKNFTSAKLILDVYPSNQQLKIGSDVYINTNGFDLDNPVQLILRKTRQSGYGFDDYGGVYLKGNKKDEPLKVLKFNILIENDNENDFTTWNYRIFGFQQLNKFYINELKFTHPVSFTAATQTSLRFTDYDDCYYKTTKVSPKWDNGKSKDYYLYVQEDIYDTQYGYQYIFIDEKEPIIATESLDNSNDSNSTNPSKVKDETSLKTILSCFILIFVLFF